MSNLLAPPIPMPAVQLELLGKQATLNEYNVGYALNKLGFSFIFRASYLGGRRMRGGVEVDFVVFTPLPLPLEVYGNYWHTGQFGNDDRLRLAIIEQFFGRKVAIIWGNESETIPDALKAVRQKLRL